MDELALVRRLRSELANAEFEIARLREHVSEAGDKFDVLSRYITDPEARKCAVERRDRMNEALRVAT